MKKLILLSLLVVVTYGAPRSAIIPEQSVFVHRGEEFIAVSLHYISESGDRSRSPTLVGPRELMVRFDATVGTADKAVVIPSVGTTAMVRPDGRNWMILVKGVSFVISDSKVYRLTLGINSGPEIRVLCDASFKEASRETLQKEIQKCLAAE